MNQREATVTIIDYVREHAPDDKRILRALRELEKRAETLRMRAERRAAPVPGDLFDEPLTATAAECREDLALARCRCGRKKDVSGSLCPPCYGRCSRGTRKALWLPIGHGYEHAFSRALRELELSTGARTSLP